jgi:Polyketide cyclase / dehydrase and lipid transport
VRLAALGLCALLVASAVYGAGLAAFCAAWLVTATVPLALRTLAIVPAAVALVTGAIVLAPMRSHQGLLVVAVGAFILETLVVAWGQAIIGRRAAALGAAEWVAVACWAAFVVALAAIVPAAGGAILVAAAVAWCLAWLVPAARRVRVSVEALIGVPAIAVYQALSQVSRWVSRSPNVLSCEALGVDRWRVASRLANGVTVDQTLRLVAADEPSRLALTFRTGAQHRIVSYSIRDDAGAARVLTTDLYVVPWATSLLGGRWNGVESALRTQAAARLDGLGERLELVTR